MNHNIKSFPNLSPYISFILDTFNKLRYGKANSLIKDRILPDLSFTNPKLK